MRGPGRHAILGAPCFPLLAYDGFPSRSCRGCRRLRFRCSGPILRCLCGS